MRSPEELVAHLRRMGIEDPLVLRAFLKVPREEFLPEELKPYAYHDTALPIGFGQTISQPFTIASMLEMLRLRPGHKVLEIGTGSGYTGALIHEITKAPVYSVEIVPELARRARETLDRLGYKDVHVFVGDGSAGLPQYAPYDRIIFHAALPEVPSPIVGQLREGGILVAPVGSLHHQDLVAYQKRGGKLVEIERRPGFVFVPTVGKYGFRGLGP
ncbi:MAG: protein-L-isoaspartate(D-aspartate) O-methyltransferase [Candidatus Diapherotrites archaeon]|nr:protein-L-isoaspartate(D-aspartate) O-methyltransferase [Candidatus Diapherotrites archaeon]